MSSYNCTFIYNWMNSDDAFVLHILEDANLVKSIMRSLESSGLLCAAGIATSLTNSGEQWYVTYFTLALSGNIIFNDVPTGTFQMVGLHFNTL